MGMMMRDGDGRQSVPGGKGDRGARAVVIRMQVMRDGVLHVSIQRSEAAQPRRINIE